MVLYKADDVVFLCSGNELVVMSKQLSCWFGDEDMDASLNGIHRDGVMSAYPDRYC